METLGQLQILSSDVWPHIGRVTSKLAHLSLGTQGPKVPRQTRAWKVYITRLSHSVCSVPVEQGPGVSGKSRHSSDKLFEASLSYRARACLKE
jgi:hypothetical protein